MYSNKISRTEGYYEDRTKKNKSELDWEKN